MIEFYYFMVVLAIILLLIAFFVKEYSLGLMSCFLFMVLGLIGLTEGIGGVQNNITESFSIIFMMVGVYMFFAGVLDEIEVNGNAL